MLKALSTLMPRLKGRSLELELFVSCFVPLDCGLDCIFSTPQTSVICVFGVLVFKECLECEDHNDTSLRFCSQQSVSSDGSSKKTNTPKAHYWMISSICKATSLDWKSLSQKRLGKINENINTHTHAFSPPSRTPKTSSSCPVPPTSYFRDLLLKMGLRASLVFRDP